MSSPTAPPKIHPDTACRDLYGGQQPPRDIGDYADWEFYDARRKKWKLAPMEGMTYTNANRCGGHCALPKECEVCKQYICPSCSKVFPFENGSTDSLDCDACWCAKEKDDE